MDENRCEMAEHREPATPSVARETRPSPPFDDDNDFHELWWDSVAGGDAPKRRPKFQLHAVWQYMGDALEPWWFRPGDSREYTPVEIYEEGWRWVRKVELLDGDARLAAVPPTGPVELGEQSNTESSPETTSAAPPSPPAVVEYTERARDLWQDLLDKDDRTSPIEYPEMLPISFDEFRGYLSAAAAEHRERYLRDHRDLTAVMYREKDEAVAKEKAALLARLREPEMREAVKAAMIAKAKEHHFHIDHEAERICDAAIARIEEMLK